MIVDLENQNYIFPPEIYNTSERPDIVIWSYKLKKVVMIELTCSAEEGFLAAKNRKTGKYAPLLQNISRQSNWKPVLLTIEMGARGFVSSSSKQTLFLLGVSSSKVHSLCKNMSEVAARCSYTIYLASSSKLWDHSWPSATKLKIIIFLFMLSLPECICTIVCIFVSESKFQNCKVVADLDWLMQARDAQLY